MILKRYTRLLIKPSPNCNFTVKERKISEVNGHSYQLLRRLLIRPFITITRQQCGWQTICCKYGSDAARPGHRTGRRVVVSVLIDGGLSTASSLLLPAGVVLSFYYIKRSCITIPADRLIRQVLQWGRCLFYSVSTEEDTDSFLM